MSLIECVSSFWSFTQQYIDRRLAWLQTVLSTASQRTSGSMDGWHITTNPKTVPWWMAPIMAMTFLFVTHSFSLIPFRCISVGLFTFPSPPVLEMLLWLTHFCLFCLSFPLPCYLSFLFWWYFFSFPVSFSVWPHLVNPVLLKLANLSKNQFLRDILQLSFGNLSNIIAY